ncbi:hypothetical protein GCM10007857_83720 [Bradyrhizobium iriomotense]|uniref:Uncharacterized protein n=1 Tax=Bradyrhizobium iriomotense TaxID=441950 RepID=A0ABQ6BE05_9BRAD|nr:hypothetical protein GCM10007857_83720 [Bradyrhizobium iriomotense]
MEKTLMPICCEMIGFAAHRLMEVERLTPGRLRREESRAVVQRDGYRAGAVELRIPKLRK